MNEVKPLTLVSLEYGDKRWGSGTTVLSEDSIVRVGTGDTSLKEFVKQRSILHYIKKDIEGEEQTRRDALDSLLYYLKNRATDSERGSLFLVQHAKDSGDYDIYILAGTNADNYWLQRIGTSIESSGGSTQILAGNGINVESKGIDSYEISLNEHMTKVNDYIGFENE